MSMAEDRSFMTNEFDLMKKNDHANQKSQVTSLVYTAPKLVEFTIVSTQGGADLQPEHENGSIGS